MTNKDASRILAKATATEDPVACWEWHGADNGHGYGYVRDPRVGKSRLAHRVVYELLVGPIAAGHDLHHKCHNRRCVNPSHMEQMKRAEHLQGHARSAGRRIEPGSICSRGHEVRAYDVGNGKYRCRDCDRERAAVRRAARKASA